MGSFSYTCAVSGLPIEAGDEVRYLLVTENPYEDSRACYMHDVWVPRTFPLRAKYNDYGSVDDVQDGPERDAWLDGFQIDLVEKGWGDNSAHDVSVKKNMTFDDLLHAIVEGRVHIKRESHHEQMAFDEAFKLLDKANEELGLPKRPKLFGRKIPKGVPTMKRIERVLTKAGLPLYGKAFSQGFMIDKVAYGEVRVRWHGNGAEWAKDAEWLGKVETLLKDKYATMISAGEGAYAHAADLAVRPKPGTKDFHGRKGLGRSKKPLAVNHVMIREDVWQALLTLKVESWGSDDGTKFHTIHNYYSYADAFIEAVRAYEAETAKRHQAITDDYKSMGKAPPVDRFLLDSHMRRHHMEAMWKNPIAAIYAKDAVPFSVGLATHWDLLAKKGPLTREFVRTAAEFAFIQRILGVTRYWWRPSYSVGPQFGEWERHEELHTALAKVIHPKAEEEAEERAEYEEMTRKHEKKKKSKKKEARS
jgi:hypothetical protein